MFTAREMDIMQIEVEAQVEKIMEECVRAFMGERPNGEETHLDSGRQPVRPGEEVRDDQRGDFGGEPRI